MKVKKFLEAVLGDREDPKVLYATSIVASIYYIKDPKTGLCYACYEEDERFAFTVVPENAIPPGSLIVAKKIK